MKTKLIRTWRVDLPASLVQQAGFADGETLECRALRGIVCLSSKGAAVSAPRKEKKICVRLSRTPPLLFRGLPSAI